MRILLLALLGSWLSGCATSNATFASFAQAGIVYQDSYRELLDAYVESEIDRSNRSVISPGTASVCQGKPNPSRCYLEEQDQLQQQLVKDINDLRSQAGVLKRYFVALNALSLSDEDLAIGDSVGALAGALAPDATLGGEKLGEALKAPVTLGVGAYRNAKLKAHLAKYGTAVARVIEIQGLALDRISQEFANNGANALAIQYTELVFTPIADDKPLPKGWQDVRKAVSGNSPAFLTSG